MDQILYRFYKIIGKTHPDSGLWKRSAKQKNQFYRETDIKEYIDEIVPITVKKVGRNDPGTCGSGKEYKKCCG